MPEKKTIAAVVVAAGVGARAGGGLPKQYRLVAGLPCLSRSISGLLDAGVDVIVPVIHADHAGLYEALAIGDQRVRAPVTGGQTRQESVRAGLAALAALDPDVVMIHDAARPFVDATTVSAVVSAALSSGGAIPALQVTDTIKRSADGRSITGTEDRRELFAAQTPQGFRYAEIVGAHERAMKAGIEFTDDAQVAEWAGLGVSLVPGSPRNIKLTRPEDFEQAEKMLERRMETRIGSGFDVHPFCEGDHVTLGGVRIAHSAGLQGHSDADAGLHALTDAIYGALGEGDIGAHFPPSDPQWRGAPSRIFLEHAAGLVAERGGRVVNLDLTLICEAPRIGPHVKEMCAVIAECCGITADRVAVKATTSERLGFTGREEGIAALASASIELPR